MSCLVMLAFVVTTMPSFAHAAMPHGQPVVAAESDQPAADTQGDCASHDDKTQTSRDASDNSVPQGEGDCCDKSCKCATTSCSTAKLLAPGVGPVISGPSRLSFAFEEQTLDSGIASRLKRPPRT